MPVALETMSAISVDMTSGISECVSGVVLSCVCSCSVRLSQLVSTFVVFVSDCGIFLPL